MNRRRLFVITTRLEHEREALDDASRKKKKEQEQEEMLLSSFLFFFLSDALCRYLTLLFFPSRFRFIQIFRFFSSRLQVIHSFNLF